VYIHENEPYVNGDGQRVRVIEFLRFERGGRRIQAVKVARLQMPGGFDTIDRDKFEREFRLVNQPLRSSLRTLTQTPR